MLHNTRLKQLLLGFQLRSTATIVNGLVNHVPKRMILKDIRKDLNRLVKTIGLNDAETNQLWHETVNRYIGISKKVFSSLRRAILNREETVYKIIKNDVFGKIYGFANDVSDRKKRDRLRRLTNKGVFYLCSHHKNPAVDHKDWEGRVYIDENWEERVSDEKLKEKIRAYIRNRGIRTIQWVVGEPVYMTVRPNCKHFFIRVDIDEVLGNSFKGLLKKHEMNFGEESLSYEERNYIAYYNKYRALKYLYKLCPNEELKKDIESTHSLVRKWADRANANKKREQN